MARTPKRIIAGAQLTTSTAIYYTAPTNQSCVIRRVSFTNTTGTAATVDLYLVASGGTAGASNQIVVDKVISPGETWSCPDVEGQVLAPGGTIQAQSDTNSAITIIGSGTEVA